MKKNFLNMKVKKLDESLESKFSIYATKLNRKKKRMISLGLGEPPFETPKHIMQSSYVAMKSGFTKYSTAKGLFELRKAISKKLKKENKLIINPDEIVITPGAKMALSLSLIALLKPGDEVVNFFPCYPSYPQQIRLAQSFVKIKNFHLNKKDFSIDFKKLAKTITKKTKVIIINFPHNPTGKMLSINEMKKLKKVLLKTNCWIISDEIYEYLNFSKKKHLSIGSDKKLSNRTITINGFSKAYGMTGWRIGYLASKNKIIHTISKIHQHMNTNVAPFIQKAALTGILRGRNHLKFYNNQLKINRDYIVRALKKSVLFSVHPSDGGLFVLINISKTKVKSDNFSYKFLKLFNVATIPGIHFGKNWDDHVRISLTENKKNFILGIQRLLKFEKQLIMKKYL